ncbi:MAG: RnfABCDGE type electron transport complex subunit D [Clostridia bacterium]|nr:RnfABCDGE type electron transport complex subunit D [Clostridia bacterium]
MNEERKENTLLQVSSAPHIRSHDSTQTVMLDVIIALLPLLLWGCYIFGMRALTVTLITVFSSVIFELLFNLITKKTITVLDLSAVVTGLLLSYNLPHTIPFWMPVLGAFFAIVPVKMLLGGLGKNLVNPALAGRACLLLSFSSAMTVPPVLTRLDLFESYLPGDALSGSTPLYTVLSPAEDGSSISTELLFDMFIGNESGTIGEVSALLILLGFLYLLLRKVVSWHIPLSYLGTVAFITLLFPAEGVERFDVVYMLAHLFSGGLLLAAVFMATDYVTSPITPKGRIIFGIGCGLLTVIVRYCAGNEGASYAVLTMNLLVYFIDKITVPRPFGAALPKLKIKKESKPQ